MKHIIEILLINDKPVKNIGRLVYIRAIVISAVLCLFSIVSFSQTYYIDFENGNDANNGTTPETAWKHCPGDANATGNAKNTVIAPGSTLLFKGGVHYRGTITIKHSGAFGAPITFRGDGWGGEKAIINGTDILDANWQQCRSAEEAGGNPNYQNIYYTSYTGTLSPFGQFFENNQRVYVAQTPNISDPFWDDRISEYLIVLNGNITRTSIKDDSFLTQHTSDYWGGAYVQIWVYPNVIVIRKVNAFDPGLHTIYFDSLSSNAIYGDRVQYYSIVNHLSCLDRPGEYVVDEINKKIYYWPLGNIENCVFSIGVRSYSIGINGCSNICIEGFKIQGNTSDDAAYAIWNNRTWGNPAENIVIRNNEITHTRTKDGRKGALSFYNVNGLLIENNYIHECQRNSGILLSSKNTTIQNNSIVKIGYKGIWSMNCENLRILNNLIKECVGTHGNPVSVFTTKNSLIANNYMFGRGEIYTFEKDTNMVLHNNIIHGILDEGQETGTNLIRQNKYCYGYTVITNNTILFSKTNFAIGISKDFEDLNKVIIKNNVADGGGAESLSRSHNIYTGLAWNQSQNQGWSLMEGEFIQKDLDSIFVNANAYDFTLKENSVARNTGINPDVIIPQEIKALFPDYDFSKDYYGYSRGSDGQYDIGAIEYCININVDNENNSPNRFALHQNYPNPFNPRTKIKYEIPKQNRVVLKVYDILGREVAKLVDEVKQAGKYEVEFSAERLSSGIYFYKITSGEYVSVKKMVALK